MRVLAHDGPCPLAPHHTAVAGTGPELRLRVVFVAERAHEAEVRRRVDLALRRGRLTGPDGATTTWRLRSSAAAEPSPAERSLGRRLGA
ncbi:hypothetical protein [Georgenia ruanii]|uniref:hypothetical protein n=1 Tax=Georgenia ruanii TaxID=348442 RepID=UPI001D00E1FB|nr:hypothetical protein [Georgenia ruanii]